MVLAYLHSPDFVNWNVDIEPMGAGPEFAANPCDEGYDTVVWSLLVGEAAKMFSEQGMAPEGKTGGGAFGTDFSASPISVIYNTMADDPDVDQGILVGLHVCLSHHPDDAGVDVDDDEVFIMDPAFDDDYPSFTFNGDVRAEVSVGYKIERTYERGENIPALEEVLTPLEEMGIDTSKESGEAVSPTGDDQTPADEGVEPQPGGAGPSDTVEQLREKGALEDFTDEEIAALDEEGVFEEPSGDSAESEGQDETNARAESKRSTKTSQPTGQAKDSAVGVGYAEDVDVNIYRTETGADGTERVEVGVDAPLDPEDVRQSVEDAINQALNEQQPTTPSESTKDPEPTTTGDTSQSEGVSEATTTAPDEDGPSETLQAIAQSITEEEEGGADQSASKQSSASSKGSTEEEEAYRKAVAEWDLSSYQKFSSGCLSEYGASVCGAVWQRLKDEGKAG